MKRFISLAAAAAMIFGAASCQKEPGFNKKTDSVVRFSVNVPAEMSTKAISDGTTVDQLVWEVYVGNKEVYHGVVDESTINPDTKAKQFMVEIGLVTNQTYDILFWAQKSGPNKSQHHYYNTSNLKYIWMREPNQTTFEANNEERDAFYGCIKNFEIKTGDIATQETVYLKRPFAQINFASSPQDWIRARPFIRNVESSNEHGLLSKVVINNVSEGFNVYNGDVTGTKRKYTFDYALSPASKDKNSYGGTDNYIKHNGADYGWTAMNYVFAPANGDVINDVTAYYIHSGNTEAKALSKTVLSVPYKQNYRTNILGEIFTGGNKFVVVVVPSYGDENSTEDPEYTIADPIMIAFQNGGDVIVNNNLSISAPLVLDGKNLVLDLNGKTITATKDLWNEEKKEFALISVKNNATLTIIDTKGGGSIIARDNDTYTFNVQGGATLNIEAGTYVGNITAVQVDEGTANIKGGHYSLKQLAPEAYGGDARFTLNCVDENYKNGKAVIRVTGGSFVNFDPSNNLAEGERTSFVPSGSVNCTTAADGTKTYTVGGASNENN